MWHTGKKTFPQGKRPVRVGYVFVLKSALQLPPLAGRSIGRLSLLSPPLSPLLSPSKAGAAAQPLGKEQYGGWWAGAPGSWGLQPRFNAETATGLNLDQHPRWWYLCWYQVWYLWLSQGDLSVCFEVGEQAREGVQRAALHLEKVSFKNHHVCLILKFTANALSVASAVSQPLISLCVF